MNKLNQEAQLVQKALLKNGLETPLLPLVSAIDDNKRKKIIANYITKIMHLLNLNLTDDSLIGTPERIANMYIDEIFSGLNYANFPKITLIKNTMMIDEIIAIHNILVNSTCEHHFISIDGKASIAYIPKNKIIGLSKINRIVHFFAQRPQVQERLTKQVLIALQTLLETNNIAVVIDAIHFCVKARGIKDVSSTITTALGGVFKTNQNIRQEFMNTI